MPARMKLRKILVGAILGVVFLVVLNVAKIYAAMSLTFTGLPSSVNEDGPFEVNVSLLDAPTNRTYYLRAALFEEGKTNYFGYTYNHSGQWHNAPSQHTQFLEINTGPEGSWSGQLRAKADLDSSYFKGAGGYRFKIGRYTEGGSLSWSNNTGSITINYTPPPNPSPTPSPEPESEPDPSPSPSPTPSVVVASPKVSPKTSTKKPVTTSLFDSHDSEEMLLSTEGGEILGSTEGAEATESKKEKSPYLIPIILGVLGLGLIGGTGVVFYKQRGYNGKDEQNREI